MEGISHKLPSPYGTLPPPWGPSRNEGWLYVGKYLHVYGYDMYGQESFELEWLLTPRYKTTNQRPNENNTARLYDHLHDDTNKPWKVAEHLLVSSFTCVCVCVCVDILKASFG